MGSVDREVFAYRRNHGRRTSTFASTSLTDIPLGLDGSMNMANYMASDIPSLIWLGIDRRTFRVDSKQYKVSSQSGRNSADCVPHDANADNRMESQST